jgi:Tol biopolymer transport system component
MSKMTYIVLTSILFATANACTTGIEDPPVDDPEEKETYFQPGEYGGEPLPGSERLFWISPSPDGEKIALIRERTPGELDPLYQLWIMDRNGDNPKLITYNTRGVDWHPFENNISFTFNPHSTPYLYAFTLNLDSFEIELLNSKEDQFFNKYTSSARGWFNDGERLLYGVHGKAYQQEYARGTYILNTVDTSHVGPLNEFFQGSLLGNNERWIVGIQYTTNNLSANMALYNFETEEHTWLTTYNTDSDSLRRYTKYPVPNPSGPEIILPKFVDNAWQLFQINQHGEMVRQLTEMGGHEVRWVREHDYFIFNRDTHKGEGASYIPLKYNFSTGNQEPLWPSQPDSVPDFPDVSTQDPIHLIDHVP